MATNPSPPVTTSRIKLVPTLIFLGSAVLILLLIFWGLWGKGGVLNVLSDRAVARGLITFMITFTTVAIALLLTVSSIVGSDGTDADTRT